MLRAHQALCVCIGGSPVRKGSPVDGVRYRPPLPSATVGIPGRQSPGPGPPASSSLDGAPGKAPEGRGQSLNPVGPGDGGHHDGGQKPRHQLSGSETPSLPPSAPAAWSIRRPEDKGLGPARARLFQRLAWEPRVWPSGLGWRVSGSLGALHSPFKLQERPSLQAFTTLRHL